jgi:HEAT repeat protein/CheY-like chemotaxis protein
MAATAFLLSAVRPVAAQEEQVLEAFKKGIAYYEAAEYDKAKEVLDKVLAAQPGAQVALKMRDLAELRVLIEMKDNQKLGPEADKLLDLMTRAARESVRKVENPEQLVRDFSSSDVKVYLAARIAIIGHGPYAVPYMLPLLVLDQEKNQTVVARAVSALSAMPPDTALPLIEALQGSDEALLKCRIAGVLGQLGDARALPALLAAVSNPKSLEPTKQAATEALVSITKKPVDSLGTADAQYADLARAYVFEDGKRVGFTYGTSSPIWTWRAGTGDLAQRLTYELVPDFLYYQRMGTEVALAGLAAAPGNPDLTALLAASQARQLALCKLFASPDVVVSGKPLPDEVKRDAAARAAKLEASVPALLSLLPDPVLGKAAQTAMEAGDGAAALHAVKALGAKLTAEGPEALDDATLGALVAALDSTDKEVRYNAAIILVNACPAGDRGPADKVMQVLSAALLAATERTALVVADDLQLRNRLVSALREKGLATTEAPVDEGPIQAVLTLQPAVDVVFISANSPEVLFARAFQVLKSDARTRSLPIFVIRDPSQKSGSLEGLTGITKVIMPEHATPTALEPLLQETVFAKGRGPSTDAEKSMVLKAAQALCGVDPRSTKYNLVRDAEPSLIKALSGYGDEVTGAAIAALARFGSRAALEPLAGVVKGEAASGLKVAACKAVAAGLKRTGGGPSEEVARVLKAALEGKVQDLRLAAAEAISVSGLGAQDMLALVRTEAAAGK